VTTDKLRQLVDQHERASKLGLETVRRKLEAQVAAELAIADTAPAPVAAPELVRRCAWCGKRLRKHVRSDARTCSKACRQAKSRAAHGATSDGVPEVSRMQVRRDTSDQRVLTRAAISRAGLVSDEPLGAARVRPATRPNGALGPKGAPID
jgi:hypothetical protein